MRALDGFRNLAQFVVTHFAFGIVTFHLTYLFRTEPGWNLVATGPTNLPKDGIAPLTGVIETDWLPYPFTMNWQMTRPGPRPVPEATSRSASCIPIAATAVVDTEPVIRNLADDPDLMAQALAWKTAATTSCSASTRATRRRARRAGSATTSSAGAPDGSAPDAQHVNKLRLAAPIDLRKKP